MKNLTLFGLLLLLLCSTASTQTNYFDQNNLSNVPLYVELSDLQYGQAFFGMEQINTNFLDVIATSNTQNSAEYRKSGHWDPNLGTGSFGPSQPPFINDPSGAYSFAGNVLVKLHANWSVKDLVVGRNNGLQVHWNSGGSITGAMQDYTNSSGTFLFFETGSFDPRRQLRGCSSKCLNFTLYSKLLCVREFEYGVFKFSSNIYLPSRG